MQEVSSVHLYAQFVLSQTGKVVLCTIIVEPKSIYDLQGESNFCKLRMDLVFVQENYKYDGGSIDHKNLEC